MGLFKMRLFTNIQSPVRFLKRHGAKIFLLFGLLFIMAVPAPNVFAYTGIPTIGITSVDVDNTVTITAYNFPAGETFTVRMGNYGTLGIGGEVVGTKDSGSGGSFTATYTIPASLHGKSMIAIRMDSATGFYYSYNWFYNNTSSSSSSTPAFTGIPSFSISDVVEDATVTVLTNNFPVSETFTVRMGAYGTQGVGGVVVGTTDSGSGGSFSATYSIPASLAGSNKIAIRMDSSTGYYYSYNWFYNNTSAVVPAPTPSSSTPSSTYTGIPTFSFTAVVTNTSVSIITNNFPSGETFTVRMGAYGTQGLGGTVVGTLDSSSGGVLSGTYNIPAAYSGHSQIAIRLDSSTGYYYSYNWFYNNTYP
ncbi:MAG: hypothetical protein JEZ06_01760 [Anaerolineaceae bacterium]|nr:hypothetical protein [Anaerolineaceae bacterium]